MTDRREIEHDGTRMTIVWEGDGRVTCHLQVASALLDHDLRWRAPLADGSVQHFDSPDEVFDTMLEHALAVHRGQDGPVPGRPWPLTTKPERPDPDTLTPDQVAGLAHWRRKLITEALREWRPWQPRN